MSKAAEPAPDIAPPEVNEVRLAGRVSHVGEERELPSGSQVVTLRVVVDRPRTRRTGGRRQVDVIEVACWSARTRRSAARLTEGTYVEVTGALRRRFFQSGGSAASRYEVEASTLRRP